MKPPKIAAMDAQKRKLLPRMAKPMMYTLKLHPRFDKNIFSSVVEISMVAIRTRAINRVCLNSVDLTIEKATLKQRNGTEVEVVCVYEPTEQTLVLRFPRRLRKGTKFTIRLEYSGPFKKNLIGLYQSVYEDGAGVQRHLATTQMEPTHARRVFPCFDEPALKAEFCISAVANKEDCCISNMPMQSEEEYDSQHKLVTFAKSERMSTYLVALVIGPLAWLSMRYNRIPVTLFTPIGMEEEGRFALEHAVKGLEIFEGAFRSRFPLRKLDLVAIPDFSSGAMENWGLLIFRMAELLMTPSECTLAKKKRIVEVVMHELSHQWFGNLVTMQYWDGLWLNEGFANWMSHFASDKLFPKWHIWRGFVGETLQTALEMDALRTSHPVEVRINNANEIGQVFDSISYRKGSSVLRMISKALGESSFLDGVKTYLDRHAYGSTTTKDLWKALGEESRSDVGRVMGIWTGKVGFPVVTVTETENSGSGSEIILRQNRFLATGPADPEEDNQLYPLQVSILSTRGVQEIEFHQREMSVQIDPLEFIKINVGQFGFYRTAYSDTRLQKVGAAAERGLFGVEEGIGILADAAALTAAGHQKTSSLLTLYRNMRFSKAFPIWTQIVKGYRQVCSAWRFEDSAVTIALKEFATDLFGEKADEMGWNLTDDDDEVVQQFKALMFDAAGSAGHKPVLAAIRDMFKFSVIQRKGTIHPELRDAVFSLSLEYGGDIEFDAMVNIFRHSDSEEERYCALENMGCVSTPCLVDRTLEFAFSDAVRDQDLHLLIWCLNASAAGAEGVWRWAKKNWQKIDEAFHSDLLRILVPVILGGLSTQSHLKDVKDFFDDRDTSLYNHILKQELERIEIRQKWAERDDDDLKQYLQAQGYLKVLSLPETPERSVEGKMMAGKGRNRRLPSFNQPLEVGA